MMKKTVVRNIALALTALMLMTFAGCEKKAEEVTDEKKELSFFFDVAGKVFKEDWPVFLEAEEMNGIHIKGYLPQSTTDEKAAFNIMMASGELADVIQTTGRDVFYKYGSEGAFLPLNDLIEKKAPNIKRHLEEHPDWKEFITANDGNIYFIPFIADGDVSTGWFIRQDWLDKLNLKTPETIDELYNVLTAFKTQDPNGNGKQDEIPYFNYPASGIPTLYDLWDLSVGLIVDDDGKIIHAQLEDRFVEATKTIAKWYKEGLIDQEIYTRSNTNRQYMIGNDLGGLTHDWFGSTSLVNTQLADEVPGLKLLPMAPPKGYDGVRRERARRVALTGEGCAIGATCKDPELAMEWMDFWFSEEGRRLMNFGIEGEDYTMIDGKPIFKDEILNGDVAVNTHLSDRGAQKRMCVWQDFAYEEQWLNDIAREGMKMYRESDWLLEPLTRPLMEQEDQEMVDNIMVDIDTLVNESIQKWVMNVEPIEETYDEFVVKMKEMGIDTALELLNKYYKK